MKQTPPAVNEPVVPATPGLDNFGNSPLSSTGQSANLATSSGIKLAEGASPTDSVEESGADEDSMSISSDESGDAETYEPEMGVPLEGIPAKLDAEDEDEPYEPTADLPTQLTSSESFIAHSEVVPLNDAKTTGSRDSREESEVADDLAPKLQPTDQSTAPLASTQLRNYHGEYSPANF